MKAAKLALEQVKTNVRRNACVVPPGNRPWDVAKAMMPELMLDPYATARSSVSGDLMM